MDFGTILRSMGMSMNGLMLEQLWECLDRGGCPDIATNFVTRKHLCGKCLNTRTLTLPPPTFHRNTFSIVFLPQKVSHELYRQLYPNIIRDIDVNSECTTSFHICERERSREWEGWRGRRTGRGDTRTKMED